MKRHAGFTLIELLVVPIRGFRRISDSFGTRGRNSSKRQSAFTLIELLVVIAIIAILAAILFPVFAQAREKARASSCLSGAKNIALALHQYTQDYDEMFCPTRRSLDAGDGQRICGSQWNLTIQPYLKNLQVFACPSDSSTTTGGFCTQAAIQNFTNGPRTQVYPGAKRSFYMLAGHPSTLTIVQPGNQYRYAGGIAGPNWGAPLSQITSPASMIMVYERYEAGGVLWNDSSVHATLIDDWCMVGNIQVVMAKAAWFNFFLPPFDPPHQQRATIMFADGHAKQLKYEQTYNANVPASHTQQGGRPNCGGNTVTWTMWDKRMLP